jgi:alanyl-tRNA synthetase
MTTPFSVELSGGTHVARTGDIGLFKITSEGALAAGVRRIEAVTREGAFAYLNDRSETLNQLAQQVKVATTELPTRLEQLMADKKKLEKQLAEAKKQLAMGGGSGRGDAAFAQETIGNITFASKAFEEINPKDLRDLATQILQQIKSGVVAVGSNFDGKAGIIVAVSKDITDKLDSAALIRTATPVVGGKGGGGRPEMAQGGGPDGAKVAEALKAVKQALEESLSKAA